MAKPLYIDVTDAPEGADLARTMRRHGLTAGLVRGSTGWQVEISSPHEDSRTFVSAVGVALASWKGRSEQGTSRRIDATPRATPLAPSSPQLG